ncbi:MAG TPA: hypothetical protein PKK82_01090 [Anaerolineaceae bacterium]|nr:DinB family protein [Chloroflexota bacterium]HNY83426.1 hypothetical protein [Anaerolineaceae bacterium]
MQVRLAIERFFERKRTICFGLDFPGCFTYGADKAEAILRFPQALLKHEAWVRLHTDSPWFELDNMDFRVVESFDAYEIQTADCPYEVNAIYQDDYRPLGQEELDQALLIYTWQREELLAGVETIPTLLLKKSFPGQDRTIEEILAHIAKAEKFYLQCFQLDVADFPSDAPLEMLAHTAKHFRALLPGFRSSVCQTAYNDEVWTARKVIRRTLWHQRDHINHIRELVLRSD